MSKLRARPFHVPMRARFVVLSLTLQPPWPQAPLSPSTSAPARAFALARPSSQDHSPTSEAAGLFSPLRGQLSHQPPLNPISLILRAVSSMTGKRHLPQATRVSFLENSQDTSMQQPKCQHPSQSDRTTPTSAIRLLEVQPIPSPISTTLTHSSLLQAGSILQ